jgi:hypothetical protein
MQEIQCTSLLKPRAEKLTLQHAPGQVILLFFWTSSEKACLKAMENNHLIASR